MMSTSDCFPELTTKDVRLVHRLAGQLVETPDLKTLGQELIVGTQKILPADFMLWNIWTPKMDALLGCEANHAHYRDELERHESALGATIHHHPVIAAGHFEASKIRPQRMSDYQSSGAFKRNPLYQEVYRHVESRYQIAYNAAQLPDSHIILSWNMQRRDFTDREVQLLHLIGMQVGVISRRLEERQLLQAQWECITRDLQSLSGANLVNAVDSWCLSAKDGRILAGSIKGETRAEIAASLQWRRDMLDRHLAMLRERFGYENTAQLLHALAALRPTQVI